MNTNKYLDDLHQIKDLMSRSSRFLSLSGFSGLLAGMYALLGAWVAHYLLNNKTLYTPDNLKYKLLLIALTVAVLTVITAYYLTKRKAKQAGDSVWNDTTKRMLIHFLIPLGTGGIFGFILLHHELYGIIAPITLIFYGLALVNASKFTLNTVKYLGISEIIVGLFASYFVGFGLYFWSFGFGVLHIVYGSIMYFREKKNSLTSSK